MAFAMRINFVDVVCDDSLKNFYINGKKMGYEFQIRLSYYRGHFLSVIDEFGIRVDGKEVSNQDVKFCLNGKEFSPCELQLCYSEWWDIMKPATIKVFLPGGLAKGDHDIDVHLMFHSPYMPTGENHQYMPMDGCGSKTLTIKE